MDLLHLHLVLNHLPVVLLAAGLLALAWSLVRRSDEVMRVALAMLVTAALAAGATFLTGEPAEDRVGSLAGISDASIERHEEAAEAALVASAIAGVLALLVFALRQKRAGALVVIAVGAIAFVLVARTANLGGKIRHTELAAAATIGGEHEDDD